MHAKKRNDRISFYRILKGSVGNSRGYARQDFVGSMPVDAPEVPDALAKRLSPKELSFVMSFCAKKETRNAH